MLDRVYAQGQPVQRQPVAALREYVLEIDKRRSRQNKD